METTPRPVIDSVVRSVCGSEVERLVMDSGELLARLHSVVPDRGMRHGLEPPDERFVARVVRVADQTLGPAAA